MCAALPQCYGRSSTPRPKLDGTIDQRLPDPLLGRLKKRRLEMTDEDKVWPTGLTLKEAEEVHSYLIDGTRVFGAIALLAHILVAVSTPWLG
jgi:light-harvesting protein B-800-850 beta chain